MAHRRSNPGLDRFKSVHFSHPSLNREIRAQKKREAEAQRALRRAHYQRLVALSNANRAPPTTPSTAPNHGVSHSTDYDDFSHQGDDATELLQPFRAQICLPNTRLDDPRVDAVIAVTPLPTLDTQLHLVADFRGDAGESTPTDHDFDAKKYRCWAAVATFSAAFRGVRHLLSSCSLCAPSDDFHFLFAHASDLAPPSYACLSELLAPCKHAVVALSYIVQRLNLPLVYPSWAALEQSLLERCTSPGTLCNALPARFPNKHGFTIDVFGTAGRRYFTFAHETRRSFCSQCKKWVFKGRSCRHRREICRADLDKLGAHPALSELDDDDGNGGAGDEELEEPQDSDYGVLSRHKYPANLATDPQLARAVSTRIANFQYGCEQCSPNRTLAPPLPRCGCTYVEYESSATIFGPIFLTGWKIKYFRCKCGFHFFDGREHGFVNYKNMYIFPVEMLMNFLESYAQGGDAVNKWWRVVVDSQKIHACALGDNSITNKIKSWRAMAGQVAAVITQFVCLLEIPPQLFKCCDVPNAIALDGIVLSVQSRHLQDLKEPWVWAQPSSPAATTRATMPRDRTLPVSTAEAALLQLLLDGTAPRSDLVAASQGHTGPALVFRLALAHSAGSTTSTVSLPPLLRDFVVSMLRDISPVTQLLPRSVWPTIEQIFPRNSQAQASWSSSLLLLLSARIPVVCNVIVCAREIACVQTRQQCLAAVSTVLWTLCDMGQAVYNAKACETRFGPPPSAAHDPAQELWTTGVFAPANPIVRTVPRISLASKEDENPCSKYGKDCTHLGPGILLFWCIEHRQCIAWSVLTRAESPLAVYEILASRFETPPPIVIYDNACNLCAYVLNRNPAMFADTVFLCDGFHHPSHTNCAPTFDSSRYKDLFKGSSVVHEQKNRDLAKLKKTAPKMGLRTLSALLMFTLTFMNQQEVEKRASTSTSHG